MKTARARQTDPTPPNDKLSARVVEKQRKASVYVVRLYCALDGAEMSWTGKSVNVQPTMYEHQCPHCKTKQLSHNCYPMLNYKEEADGEDLPG